MIDSSRSILNQLIPDVYFYSDVYKGEDSGKYVKLFYTTDQSLQLSRRSSGYARSLVAEPTIPALHYAEAVSILGGIPEDVALMAVRHY